MARTVSEQFGTLWNVSDTELAARAASLAGAGVSAAVELLDVSDYNGCFDALSMLRSAAPVIVRIEDVPGEIKAELMDFLCGAAFALDVAVERVRPGSFLFAPHGVHVSDDDIWHTMYR
jgi:FtsZ-interacting cell division protein YlmF